MIDRLRYMVLLGLAICTQAAAQYIPQSAHVNLYFPQLADGGPAQSQWQTAFLFSNPSESVARVVVLLFDNNGQPLALDFGSGPTDRVVLDIPSFGSRLIRSRVASPTTVVGWAQAFSDVPIQGTVEFRTIENGIPKLAVNAEATQPSPSFFYPANVFTGFAFGNVLESLQTTVRLLVFDGEGRQVGDTSLTLGPNAHASFTLLERFPGLGTGFEGTVAIESARLRSDFVAWALRSDSSGVISSLPPGRFKAPASHFDDIWLAFTKIQEVARSEVGPVDLEISSDAEINAYATPSGVIRINLAIAELISDSPSELAHLIGHEFGHIYQFRNSGQRRYHPNGEKDADIWGMYLAVQAGYDPYGAAGVLAKSSMATGTADLVSQAMFHNMSVTDAHGSFNERIATVYDEISFACSQARDDCESLKSILHPHFPASAPLIRAPEGRTRPGP